MTAQAPACEKTMLGWLTRARPEGERVTQPEDRRAQARIPAGMNRSLRKERMVLGGRTRINIPGIFGKPQPHRTVAAPDMQELVDLYHGALYRFALGLSGSEHSAADLTQETYFLWATKGHQLRDVTRVRAWLFTTLHREFLAQNRRERRFPQEDLDSAEGSLPVVEPAMVDAMDCAVVMESLNRVELNYRAPLLLFYLEDMAYRDIAVALELPIGTVMSRISRGKAQLRVLLRDAVQRDDSQVIPMPQVKPNRSQMS